VYEQIREKVAELAKSSEVSKWAWFGVKFYPTNQRARMSFICSISRRIHASVS